VPSPKNPTNKNIGHLSEIQPTLTTNRPDRIFPRPVRCVRIETQLEQLIQGAAVQLCHAVWMESVTTGDHLLFETPN